jgi:hypothetical protein
MHSSRLSVVIVGGGSSPPYRVSCARLRCESSLGIAGLAAGIALRPFADVTVWSLRLS